ncbi:hypothetical protein BK049_14565 [Bacillus xiamenensis]|uniref:Uncharacterized protein n=1 Tax=Bacillus xiamenensis TaxID=1178537 RepID=A0AAC9IK48_9BACI|nr:hypothetical protein [Bacillus xiamenensis]AOZ89804.1 hypothetical protein BK049_14565 [Bacillus xiamenensis]
MTKQIKPSNMLLIALSIAIISLVMILGKIDTPVTNVLFYIVALGIMGFVVSSLVKDYKKRQGAVVYAAPCLFLTSHSD